MVTLNLIPEATQVAQTRQRHLKRWATLSTVALLASAIPIAARWAQHARVEELKGISAQLLTDVDAARKELRSITAETHDVTARLERANALRAKRNWSGLLSLVASSLPADCWLTSLATEPDVPSAAPAQKPVVPPAPGAGTGAAPAPEKPAVVLIEAPRKLRMSGQATDASQPLAFVTRLKDSKVFRDVVLERTQRENDETTPRFRFDVVCEW